MKVTWEPDPSDPGWRWVLSVQDTGPELQAGVSAPFARALKAATDDIFRLEYASARTVLLGESTVAITISRSPHRADPG